jgi:hypothetical protein
MTKTDYSVDFQYLIPMERRSDPMMMKLMIVLLLMLLPMMMMLTMIKILMSQCYCY